MSQAPTVYLKKRKGELVEATLLEDMTRSQVAEASRSWRPFIEERQRQLIAQQVPRTEWPEHHHWDWERKSQRYGHLLSYRFIGIEHSGSVQGLMMVDLDTKRSQIPEQQGKPLIYVEYLSSAPWNSPLFVTEPRFIGVGTILVAAVIELSFEQGYKGRIGLHSLPQADLFYQRCGMTDLGIDAHYENLRYFEMTTEQAEQFRR